MGTQDWMTSTSSKMSHHFLSYACQVFTMSNTTLIASHSAQLLLLILNMMTLTWHQALLLLVGIVTVAADDYVPKNVYGEDLQPCSSDGSALTGYTRSGSCVDYQDDAGSHHICINLSSMSSSGRNFCQVTGQSDWCSANMPCHENESESCQVENWCVCQWAFASYIDKAGGCDAIQYIQCDAINMQALSAYASSSDDKHRVALQCIYTRCMQG